MRELEYNNNKEQLKKRIYEASAFMNKLYITQLCKLESHIKGDRDKEKLDF